MGVCVCVCDGGDTMQISYLACWLFVNTAFGTKKKIDNNNNATGKQADSQTNGRTDSWGQRYTYG